LSGKIYEKIGENWDPLESELVLLLLLLTLPLKMLVNQGETELGEGLKAKKTVKATKANTNPYAKTTVLLVLMMETRLLRSEIRVPPVTGACFDASTMATDEEFSCFCLFCQTPQKWKETETENGASREREREREERRERWVLL
jgi:hypothetical protein